MNFTTKISGFSDDIIYVETFNTAGEIIRELSHEFYPPRADDYNRLNFSDGTVLAIRYDDDGSWKIEIDKAGSGKLRFSANDGPDSKNYSDVVELSAFDPITVESKDCLILEPAYEY